MIFAINNRYDEISSGNQITDHPRLAFELKFLIHIVQRFLDLELIAGIISLRFALKVEGLAIKAYPLVFSVVYKMRISEQKLNCCIVGLSKADDGESVVAVVDHYACTFYYLFDG
jgi:hypothetical protein